MDPSLSQGELWMDLVSCRFTVGSQSFCEVVNALHSPVLAQKLASHSPSAYLPRFYSLSTSSSTVTPEVGMSWIFRTENSTITYSQNPVVTQMILVKLSVSLSYCGMNRGDLKA